MYGEAGIDGVHHHAPLVVDGDTRLGDVVGIAFMLPVGKFPSFDYGVEACVGIGGVGVPCTFGQTEHFGQQVCFEHFAAADSFGEHLA